MKTNADHKGILLPLKNRIDSLSEGVYDENFEWQKLLSVLKIQILPTDSKTKKIVSSILMQLNDLLTQLQASSKTFHKYEYMDVGEIFNLGYSQDGLAKVTILDAVERDHLETSLKIELGEYKSILQNYNLINEIDFTANAVNAFKYLGNDDELTDILKTLKSRKFVSEETNFHSFRSAFAGKASPKTKITWTSTIEKLNHFIKMLKEYKMIENPNKEIWNKTKLCFHHPNIDAVNKQSLRNDKIKQQINEIISPYRLDQ